MPGVETGRVAGSGEVADARERQSGARAWRARDTHLREALDAGNIVSELKLSARPV